MWEYIKFQAEFFKIYSDKKHWGADSKKKKVKKKIQKSEKFSRNSEKYFL